MLQAQLSTMQLGSTLSVTAKPFNPLATSLGTVMAPSAAPRPLAIGDQPTRALYTSDDDGTTTDASVVPKKNLVIKGAVEVVGGEGDPKAVARLILALPHLSVQKLARRRGLLLRSLSLSTLGREGTSTMSPPSAPGLIPSPTTVTTMRTTICSCW